MQVAPLASPTEPVCTQVRLRLQARFTWAVWGFAWAIEMHGSGLELRAWVCNTMAQAYLYLPTHTRSRGSPYCTHAREQERGSEHVKEQHLMNG